MLINQRSDGVESGKQQMLQIAVRQNPFFSQAAECEPIASLPNLEGTRQEVASLGTSILQLEHLELLLLREDGEKAHAEDRHDQAHDGHEDRRQVGRRERVRRQRGEQRRRGGGLADLRDAHGGRGLLREERRASCDGALRRDEPARRGRGVRQVSRKRPSRVRRPDVSPSGAHASLTACR